MRTHAEAVRARLADRQQVAGKGFGQRDAPAQPVGVFAQGAVDVYRLGVTRFTQRADRVSCAVERRTEQVGHARVADNVFDWAGFDVEHARQQRPAVGDQITTGLEQQLPRSDERTHLVGKRRQRKLRHGETTAEVERLHLRETLQEPAQLFENLVVNLYFGNLRTDVDVKPAQGVAEPLRYPNRLVKGQAELRGGGPGCQMLVCARV